VAFFDLFWNSRFTFVLVWEGIQQVPRSCGVFFQVRFCKATQEAREAMSADLVRELREKYGEAKAEEIHPNQEHNCSNDGCTDRSLFGVLEIS